MRREPKKIGLESKWWMAMEPSVKGRVRLSVDRDQAGSRGSIVRGEKGQVSYLRVSSCQEVNA